MPGPAPASLAESFQPVIGQPVTLRPLRPDDIDIEFAFVTGLSEATRANRLLGGAVRVTDEYVRRLTRIDWSREAALAAVVMLDGAEVLIGVARYVGDKDGRACEFALVVADAWQGRGIGRRLLGKLVALARERGYAAIYGDTLATNAGMLHLARKLGFHVAPHPGDRTLARIRLALA